MRKHSWPVFLNPASRAILFFIFLFLTAQTFAATPSFADVVQINDVKNLYNVFSPNGNGSYDIAEIQYLLTKNAAATIKLYNSSNVLVRTLLNNVNQTAGQQNVTWNGKNDSNVILPNGVYAYKIDAQESTGAAAAQKTGTLTIDNAYMTLTQPANNSSAQESTPAAQRVFVSPHNHFSRLKPFLSSAAKLRCFLARFLPFLPTHFFPEFRTADYEDERR